MKRYISLIEDLTGLFYILWFFLPVTLGVEYEFLHPYKIGNKFLIVIPVFGLYKLINIFLHRKMGYFGNKESVFHLLSRVILSSIMIYTVIDPVITNALNKEYLKAVSIGIYLQFTLLLFYNFLTTALLFRGLNRKSSSYRNYLEYQKENKTGINFFGIRIKLFLSFISIITAILLILSTNLLNSYRETIIKAVSDGASNQVQQTSANYRINLGDNIALEEYMTRQVELNNKATFNYNNLSIFTSFNPPVYQDEEYTDFPEYKCEYSTLAPSTKYPELESLDKLSVVNYFKNFKESRDVLIQEDYSTFKFISPIIKIDTIKDGENRFKKSRLLGYTIITFEKNIIMKPYYKIRNLVFALTFLFLYISIVLIYISGTFIVNPILFLRMNVKKVSDILSRMISGESRVAASSLVYSDMVHSKDEISSLSREINNMVNVIKGIVPYISASTLKNAESGETSSVAKDLTFLFTDIRGFTTLCEGKSPVEVVAILNKYLDLETEIILRNGGDIDKFVGDEMMAFFDGPNRDLNACRASMEIREAMMNEKDIRERDGLHIVEMGIGINGGPVIFGSMGARERMDFTSIGDTVNLAARLEGANKAYGSKSIISESVYNNIKEIFLCRELDFIAVKGKNQPVRIYEIIQEKIKSTPKLMEIIELFESGLKEYRAKNWDKAMEFFLENHKKYGDKPSKVFMDRINHFKINPVSSDWDGIFRMEVK